MGEVARPQSYHTVVRDLDRRISTVERIRSNTTATEGSQLTLGQVTSVTPGGAPDGSDLVTVSYGAETREAGYNADYSPTAGDQVVLWVRPEEVLVLCRV